MKGSRKGLDNMLREGAERRQLRGALRGRRGRLRCGSGDDLPGALLVLDDVPGIQLLVHHAVYRSEERKVLHRFVHMKI